MSSEDAWRIRADFLHLFTFTMENSGPRMLKNPNGTALLNSELCGVINLCLWNILNTLESNYCCAYSHSYINICTCGNSAPWHLLKWLHWKMRQIDSETGVGSQCRGRQSLVNSTNALVQQICRSRIYWGGRDRVRSGLEMPLLISCSYVWIPDMSPLVLYWRDAPSKQ